MTIRPLALAALAALVACASEGDPEGGVTCGVGTHLEDGVCVADVEEGQDGQGGEGDGMGEGEGEGNMGGERRVFVTRTAYRGDLGGAAGADSLCQDSADAVELGGEWVAWVSALAGDARERVTGDGPWLDLAGEVVFANRAAFSTTPRVGILIQEDGEPITGGLVWTGTGAGGSSSDRTCGGWTTSDYLQYGTMGYAGDITTGWTDELERSCDDAGRLYCFEI